MTNLFEFPKYAAILNAGSSDFKMSLSGPPWMSQTKAIDTGGDPRAKLDPETVFKQTVGCDVCDAVLLMTPYFRIASAPPSFPDGLATARFSMIVDSEIYILDGSVKNHLTDIQGNIPVTAKLDFSKPKKGAFWANMISAAGTIPRSTFGYFVGGGSVVSIEVRSVVAGYGKIELEAGFVSALYTTRIEKKDA